MQSSDEFLEVLKFIKFCVTFGVRFYEGPGLAMLRSWPFTCNSKLVDVEKLLVHNLNFISYNL